MKIAIQNPMLTTGYGDIGIHNYIIDFIRANKPHIFLTRKALYLAWLKFVRVNKLRRADYRVFFSPQKLNAAADALIFFGGQPTKPDFIMPRAFTGLKIAHVMDYMFRANESYAALQNQGVDYVFGYAAHDRHCDFFKKYYPAYIGRVIPVPFGFHPRFVNTKPFNERAKKIVALGSVSVFGSRLRGADFFDAIQFFLFDRREPFMHKWRRMLQENEHALAGIMASRLPAFPQESDFRYDLVKEFNEYQLFTCCESVFYFPAAKTFEGPAAGSVLVCSDHPCFTDLGFIDGVNCIRHKQFDIADFRDKITAALADQTRLAAIQKAGTALVTACFSHRAIAEDLYRNIEKISATYSKQKAS